MVNNDYTHWEMYAIGGSANPTINSQGNRFLAPDNQFHKEVNVHLQLMSHICSLVFNGCRISMVMGNVQVTKHQDSTEGNWRSLGDLMLNGAFFTASGSTASSSYAKASSMAARPSSIVGSITAASGALNCKKGSSC